MVRNNSQCSLVFFFIFKLPSVLKFKRVYIVCTLLIYQLHQYRCIYHLSLHILWNIFKQFVAFVIYHDNLNRILWDDQRSVKFSFFRLNARCQFAWFTLNLIVGFIDFKDGISFVLVKFLFNLSLSDPLTCRNFTLTLLW